MRADFLQRLMELPENASLSYKEEAALLDYIRTDLNDGEELFLTLAEHSLAQARSILTKLEPQMRGYELRECRRIIAQCEEAQEARELAELPQDELDARFALLALLPPELPDSQRMKRVLTHVRLRLDPVSALKQLEYANPHEDDYNFHRSLLRELFWCFYPTYPSLALRCLRDGQDARHLLATLLAQPDTPEEFCLDVLGHVITLTSGSVFNEYKGHTLPAQIARSPLPYQLALFARMAEHTDRIPTTLRFLLIERIVSAAHVLSRVERCNLGSVLSQEALPLLTPQERQKAERLLYREKFVP